MTVVTMSSLFFLSVIFFYFLQHILWSRRLVGSLVGRMAGSLLDGGDFDSLALITEEPLVGIDVWSLMVKSPGADVTNIVALQNWMVLSS
jgi:hypothetical protein